MISSLHPWPVCLRASNVSRVRLLLVPLLGISLIPTLVAADECLWIEAEQYQSSNFADHWEVSSMGKPGLLSGGEWIMRGVGADEIAKLVSEEGVTLQYAVPETVPGTYRLWARVGWFRSRADFQWRIGDGQWRTLPHDAVTTNLMELGFFTEVSWADLGDVDLGQATTLQIRYPRVTGEKQRMLMALDCLALIQGEFIPDGPFRPGQTYDGSQDRAAAKQTYHMRRLAPGVDRTELSLSGLWQVARYDDPNMDVDTYRPVMDLPDRELRWTGVEVPGDVWKIAPLVFGHRLVYRTRFSVPAEASGRGFKLHFSGTNWIVSVFVNGQLAGTHKGVWVPWDLDISRYVRPGEVNELSIAVKGTYYALDPGGMGGHSIHAVRNRPLQRKEWSRWVAPMYPSVKGDGDGYLYGIVNPVTLVCTGPCYTEDVFVKPSVSRETLGLEYAIRNTSNESQQVSAIAEAICDTSGETEHRWKLKPFTIAPGATAQLKIDALPFPNPKLWWPQPDPNLYRLRTTLSVGGRPLDVHVQLFGFREVTLQGNGLHINGVRRNLWNWVDVSAPQILKPEDWADAWRREGDRFMRFSHGRKITQVLKTREERLEFYDRAGIPGRLCTMIDGMFISYRLLDRQGSGKERTVTLNDELWKNFRDHMAQVARAYRNHPSVLLYQAENELVYINGMNVYGGDLDLVEQAMNDVVEAGREFDPTRPYTVGGGGDLSGRLEINAPHYPTASPDWYPENAYTVDKYATKIERWPWDRSKPWQVGECSFANHLGLGTLVSGSMASRSKQHARQAKAKYLRMLYGGYRWAGVSAFFPWDNLSEFEDAEKVFSDICIIPRKQTQRLFANKKNELLFKVMNDTLSSAPVEVHWLYEVAGRPHAAGKELASIEPGFGHEFTVVISAPDVDRRVDGRLSLKAFQNGVEQFFDERSVPVLPAVRELLVPGDVWVYDPQRVVADYLAKVGRKCGVLDSLEDLRGRTGLLIIGPDALSAREAFEPNLLAFAVTGGRVICLEQKVPPAGAALPVALRPTQGIGGYAHPAALGTSVYQDLGADDLIDWAGDHPTYKGVYQKPSQGARSLANAGTALQYSPLIEVPCGKGVILLCQLRVGAKLQVDPAADILLRNLINVYGSFRPASGMAALYAPGNSLLAEKVTECGILVEEIDSIAAALDHDKYTVAIVDGTAENLQALAGLGRKVEEYQLAGRWLMLANLRLEAMDSFNAMVDGDFMLRPFRMESVTLLHNEFKLAATLSDADLALLSPEKIMHSTYWASSNTFSGVIDATNEFGRFTLPPGADDDPFVIQPTRDDHDPYNFVNGLMADDSWRYTQQIWVSEEGKTDDLVFRLRKPELLQTIQVWNLDTYGTFSELDVLIDGDETRPIRFSLPAATQLETLRLPEPLKVSETITLRPTKWALKGRRNRDGEEIRLAGINNIAFLRPEEPKDVVALDSVGGLVALPKGPGGVFVNLLKFMEDEPKEANEAQKVRVLGTVLANMGVGFRSSSSVAVPGVNVRFYPVKLQEYGNAYLDAGRGDQAWFGTPKDADLALLPRGQADFADVSYHVTDYATAPTPDVIILGGEARRWNPPHVRQLEAQVNGIRIGRRADMIYFLHAAHVGGPVTERERQQMQNTKRPFELPVVMKYVLHYADGETREIPVTLEQQIDHWVQPQPKPLYDARIGWQKPLTELDNSWAVLYSMQAANPRPEVAIHSIDILRTSDRAVPAVLGITLGEVIQ